MNLPNKLSVSRIVMAIMIIILLLFPWYEVGVHFPSYNVNGVELDLKYIIAGSLFIVASITDFVDGYVARKYGLITNTGKMLDAIADKLLVNSVLIILASTNKINPIIPVIVVFRDIVVNAIKMEAASKGTVVAAIGAGKIKTAMLMVGMVLVFFNNIPFEYLALNVADFLLYFATLMSVISMIQYYDMNKTIIFEKS